MHLMCEQPGDRAGLTQGLYVQLGDKAGLARQCVSNWRTRLYMHVVCAQHGDRAGLAQGSVCSLRTRFYMHVVCEQSEDKTDHAQGLYVQLGDKAGLAQSVCATWGQGSTCTWCVCNMGTGLAFHSLFVQCAEKALHAHDV